MKIKKEDDEPALRPSYDVRKARKQTGLPGVAGWRADLRVVLS